MATAFAEGALRPGVAAGVDESALTAKERWALRAKAVAVVDIMVFVYGGWRSASIVYCICCCCVGIKKCSP